MRLFIAIDLPEEINQYCKDLQSQIISSDAKLSLTNDFHLTLKFLGEVPENKVEEIKSLLSTIRFGSFAAKTSSIGFFPDAKSIRVVWLGVEPINKISELQKLVDSSLSSLFPKDNRFHPHLTLARVKFVKNRDYINLLRSIKPEQKEFIVSSFKLIKSTLTTDGPVYHDLAEFKGITNEQ